MKSYLSLFLLITTSIIFSNCKTKKFTPSDFPESLITFGSGGGFTGEVVCYHLLENGQIFKQDGIKANLIELETLKKTEVESYFQKANDLNLEKMKFNNPGDLYFFIESKDAATDKVNKITWGHPDHETPEGYEAYYESLQALVKNRNKAEIKK